MSEYQYDGTKQVLLEILAERERQDSKWGKQNHDPAWWMTILGEEFGEACEAALQAAFDNDGPDRPWSDYREELVQIAAVAVAATECLDRSGLV